MKKRGNLFKILLLSLFVFVFNTANAYAATHDFSFKFYNCYSLNEAALQDVVNPDTNRVTTKAHFECNGPNNNGNVPLMTKTNITGVGQVYKLDPGQIIKVGVHYKPGTPNVVGQQVKFYYDYDSFEPVMFSNV